MQHIHILKSIGLVKAENSKMNEIPISILSCGQGQGTYLNSVFDRHWFWGNVKITDSSSYLFLHLLIHLVVYDSVFPKGTFCRNCWFSELHDLTTFPTVSYHDTYCCIFQHFMGYQSFCRDFPGYLLFQHFLLCPTTSARGHCWSTRHYLAQSWN